MANKSSVQKTMEILISTETVADKIMLNKQEIIALDKRRQETREAIRETTKQTDAKVWITIGSMLVKMKKDKALELLSKDKMQIDIEISKLQSEQKFLVNQHRDLEHLSPFQGTNLKALSSKEISALKSNLPTMGPR